MLTQDVTDAVLAPSARDAREMGDCSPRPAIVPRDVGERPVPVPSRDRRPGDMGSRNGAEALPRTEHEVGEGAVAPLAVLAREAAIADVTRDVTESTVSSVLNRDSAAWEGVGPLASDAMESPVPTRNRCEAMVSPRDRRDAVRERCEAMVSAVAARDRGDSMVSAVPTRERVHTMASDVPARDPCEAMVSAVPARHCCGPMVSPVPGREGSGVASLLPCEAMVSPVRARDRTVVPASEVPPPAYELCANPPREATDKAVSSVPKRDRLLMTPCCIGPPK